MKMVETVVFMCNRKQGGDDHGGVCDGGGVGDGGCLCCGFRLRSRACYMMGMDMSHDGNQHITLLHIFRVIRRCLFV